VDALYFSYVTMTTIGYGDLHPKTVYGKLVGGEQEIGFIDGCVGVSAVLVYFLCVHLSAVLRLLCFVFSWIYWVCGGQDRRQDYASAHEAEASS
jgi:hypothetical protein